MIDYITKCFKRIINFIADNDHYIIILIILLILMVVIALFTHQGDLFIHGSFIIFTAVITAILAIHKYYSEQRTNRLQKLYFEDTFLSMMKCIENIMSETNKNMMFVESLYSLSINLINNSKDIESAKKELVIIFDKTEENIQTKIIATDFKKETISHIFYNSEEKNTLLTKWIQDFEDDSYRFSFFLRGQILFVKNRMSSSDSRDKSDFITILDNILKNYISDNYKLIHRHYILHWLFFQIILEASAINYKNIQQIFEGLKGSRVTNINKLINEYYKEVISNFNGLSIGNINSSEADKLDEKVMEILRERGRNAQSF